MSRWIGAAALTRRDGLGRLRTEHRALPGIPFADFEHDGIALETPERLHAQTEADRRPEAALNWLQANCVPYGNLVPAPDGSAFLVARFIPEGNTGLWYVPTDGRPDRLVNANVYRHGETVNDYQWSPDSRRLVLVRLVNGVGTRLVLQDAATGSETEIATVYSVARPGVTTDGMWYAQSDGLWKAPWTGGSPQRVMAWPSDPRFAPAHHVLATDPATGIADAAMVRPAPDGARVVYSCRGGLCFSNTDGSERAVVDTRVSNVTWSPDGQQIAAVARSGSESPYSTAPGLASTVWLIRRDGTTQTTVTVAPDGWVSPPAWTLDSRRLFLTTCPLDGRRIITVDAADGEVRDLSQPRWDAWAALIPGENALLLSNGRGGYWRAGIRGR